MFTFFTFCKLVLPYYEIKPSSEDDIEYVTYLYVAYLYKEDFMAQPKKPKKDTTVSAYDTYLQSLKDSQKQNEDFINSSYGALISSAYAKKNGINAQADTSFKDTYSTSRVSALGNNEALATKGLAGNAYDNAQSGYSESSRIAQDNNMQNGFTQIRVARDKSLADVDREVMELEFKRSQDLQKNNTTYGDIISKTYIESEKAKSDQLNKDRDYELDVAKQKADKDKFTYQKVLDKQKQDNWKKEQSQKASESKQKQTNWEKEQAAKAKESAQKQANWEKERADKLATPKSTPKGGSGGGSKYTPKSKSGGGNTSNTGKTNNKKTTTDNKYISPTKGMTAKQLSEYNSTAIRPSADTYYNYIINPLNMGNAPGPKKEYLDSLLKSGHVNKNEYEYLGKRLGFTVKNGRIIY